MYKPVTLKEITKKIGSGSTPKGGKESYQSNGTSLIRSLNVYDFTFQYKDLAFINEEQSKKLEGVKVFEDDLLLNITGASVGRCTIVPSDILPARVNQHVSIIRVDREKADPKFVLYSINSDVYKKRLLAISDDGATREALTKDDIEKFQILLPSLSVQKHISSILSAYDDLIEVNNQRIKLLEETARELYKEWFVRMRFPGYKKTKFVKGIPQGWGIGNVSQIAQINLRTAKLPSSTEIKYVDISSVGSGVIESSSDYQFKDAPGRARRLVHHGDIIFSTVRPENRSFAYVLSPPKNLVVSTGFAVISPADTIFSAFLLNIISSDAFVEEMVNKSKGAAYPQVSFDDIKRFTFLKPTSEVLKAFEGTVHTMYEQVSVLRGMNRCLKDIRDLLLPRLISGKLRLKEPKEAKVVAIKQPSVSMVAEAEMSYKKKAK